MFKYLLFVILILAYVEVRAEDAFLTTQVTKESVDKVILELKAAHNSKPKGEALVIKLDSPGGSIFAGFTLMNYIKALQATGREVNGVVTGWCASMCFVILQTLDVRMALPHAILMQHMPTGGNSDVLEELERHVQEFEAKRIGIPLPFYRLMVKANIWFMSDRALKYNFIDKIVVESI